MARTEESTNQYNPISTKKIRRYYFELMMCRNYKYHVLALYAVKTAYPLGYGAFCGIWHRTLALDALGPVGSGWGFYGQGLAQHIMQMLV